MSDIDPFDPYSSLDDDIGLDPEDRAQVRSNKQDWYKAEKGRVDRVALLYFNTIDVTAARIAKRKHPEATTEQLAAIGRSTLEARAKQLEKPVDALTQLEKLNLNDVRFKKFNAHFHETVGFVVSRLGLDGPAADEAWRRLDPPKQYFTTLLLVYPTTREGDPIKERLATGWKILPFRFSPERYQQICKRNNSLVENGITIASQDLVIECKDTQYQNITLDGAGPAIYRKNPKFQELILTKALEYYDKLNPFREITSADLRIKLGMGGGGGSSASIGSDDFGDVLNNV